MDDTAASTSLAKNLPNEIWRDILSWVPAKTLMKLRYVCKSWYTLISDTSFIRTQLSRSWHDNDHTRIINIGERGKFCLMPTTWRSFADKPKLERPALRAPRICTTVGNIGSCNGLICFKLDGDEGDRSFSTIFMWNPLVKIFKVLPPCDFTGDSILGFGYHQPANDYKVVATCYRGRTASRAEVYSLSLDSWKKIDAANLPCNPYGTSVSFNGNIHWLPQELHAEGKGCVVLFNIGEESFGEMGLPDYRPAYPLNQYNMHTEIQVANEALCFLVSHQSKSSLSTAYLVVWVMREPGVADSWIKKFSLVLNDIWWVSSIRLSVNGKIYHYKYHTGNQVRFVVYDPADNCYRTVDVFKGRAFHYQVVTFKESLAFMDCQWLKGFYSGTLIAV
ncbi:hypothetical protein RJ639_014729 [Escallonia herrerae]|uniref:F-box domain-containing protein n=1 Tax=Escallonia herrerae TaxID=1293975 RepID=A0AA88VKB0_9ASTE|nr:hypothetical protein RJ639_014729 [Escallonia herrerae]